MKVSQIFAAMKLSGEAFIMYQIESEQSESFELATIRDAMIEEKPFFPGNRRHLSGEWKYQYDSDSGNINVTSVNDEPRKLVLAVTSNKRVNDVITLPAHYDANILSFDTLRYNIEDVSFGTLDSSLEFVANNYLGRNCVPGQLTKFNQLTDEVVIGLSQSEKIKLAEAADGRRINRYVQIENSIIGVVSSAPQKNDEYSLSRSSSFALFMRLEDGKPFVAIIDDDHNEFNTYELEHRLYIYFDSTKSLIPVGVCVGL